MTQVDGDRKPRLLHIAPNAREAGGLERFVALRAQRDNRYEHHLLSFSRPDPDYVVRFKSHATIARANRADAQLRTQLERVNPDSVIVYNRPGLLRRITSLTKTKAIPVVFSVHDYAVISIGPGYNRLTLKTGNHSFFYLPLARDFSTRKIRFQSRKAMREKLSALNAATAIECPSESMRLAVKRWTKTASFVAPPYCRGFSTSRSSRHERSLLFAGALTRGKGLRLLMKSLNRLRAPFRITVIGRGYLENELKKWAARTGGELRLAGWVPPRQMSEYYRRATVVVVPSILESFGMVAMEAMAHSRTVVAYDTPGIADQVQHGFNGLLARPFDWREYAELIEQLLEDPIFRWRLEHNAHDHASNRYSDRQVEASFDRLMRHCGVHAPG